MTEPTEVMFFLWETKDGRVAVEATMPTVDVWPLQTMRVTGLSPIRPPSTPMTNAEFNSWREGLCAAGFKVDIRFK
jgi:hypothetical protein